jgi:putative alpha-1,2-mannosidase
MRFKHLFLYGVLFLSFSAIKAQNNKYVDLFIGTSGDNGQVDPAASVPYGMVRICPDMKPRSHSGYDYNVNTISGFSINRLSGIGCGGNGGNLSLRPAQKDIALNLIKSTERAFPGYYTVALDNGVRSEFTATQNVAAERFYFSKEKEAMMTLNVASSFTGVREAEFKVVSDTEIEGFVKTGTTCDAGEYKLFFNLKTSRPFKEVSRTNHLFEFSFGVGDNKPVELRVALSPIDILTAREENERVSNLSFEKLKSSANKQWADLLGKVEVNGGTADDKVLFYTSLYRTFLSPMNVTSWNRKFLATDGRIQSAKDFTYYSSWSMWDSYRTKFPLITLLEPEKMKDICKSLSRLYVYGKKGWATPFESSPTVRTEHTIATLLDAYNKGITDIDLGLAYNGLKKEVDALETKRPDQAYETCVDLWSMSRIANIEGKMEDAKSYGDKADGLFKTTWEKEFMNVDSSYAKMRDNGLYQGSRWQYRWLLTQYLDEMAKSVGGKNKLAEQLDYYFTNSLNNQGNEVSLQAAFIFNRLGHPDLTQKVVTDMLTKETKHLYGGNAEYPKPIYSRIFKRDPKGFLPEMDEDDGTMSSWYVLASIGLFPLTTGEPWYEITSPLFDTVVLKLNDGKRLTIQTKNRKSAEDKIKSIEFNGSKVSDFKLDHNLLVKGGILKLEY